MIPIPRDGADLVRALLSVKSERDQQRTIGASSFGSPCDYCVANDLIGVEGSEEYRLATSLGTATHEHLERLEAEHLPGAIIEQKITLGTLEDYGTINSKPDLVLPAEDNKWWLIDHKSSQLKKVKEYRKAYHTEEAEHEFATLTAARFTMKKYLGQLTSYARGLRLAGYDVERMTLVFIPRDGKKLSDIEAFDFWYDEDYADLIWTRLEALWDFIRGGGDVTELESAPGCFPCEMSSRV